MLPQVSRVALRVSRPCAIQGKPICMGDRRRRRRRLFGIIPWCAQRAPQRRAVSTDGAMAPQEWPPLQGSDDRVEKDVAGRHATYLFCMFRNA